MDIKIHPIKKGDSNVQAFIIKGKEISFWLSEIGQFEFKVNDIRIYPIPGQKANEVYGCLIVGNPHVKFKDINGYTSFKLYENRLFIPLNSDVSPRLSQNEISNIFKCLTVYHPDFGYVELAEEINWDDLIKQPIKHSVDPMGIIEAPRQPNQIKSFKLFVPILKTEQIEESLDIKPQAINDKLSFKDKMKFKVLGLLFTVKRDGDKGIEIKRKSWGNWISSSNNFQKDYGLLYNRNQNNIDKLLQLFKVNPKLAMRFAKQLDLNGTTRGFTQGNFGHASTPNKSQKSFNNIVLAIFVVFCIVLIFSAIFDQSSGRGVIGWVLVGIILFFVRSILSMVKPNGHDTGAINTDNKRLLALQKAYRKQAKTYKKQGEYKEAARIYLNLLKDPYEAAKTLEEGRYHQEAAHIYLKFCQRNNEAALCYENGQLYSKALELYIKMQKRIDIGRMYQMLGDDELALNYFKKEIDHKISNNKYIQAACIYKDHLKDDKAYLDVLLMGWNKNIESVECLGLYFRYFTEEVLNTEIKSFYKNNVTLKNNVLFLMQMKKMKGINEEIKLTTRKMAYEIVAEVIKSKKDAIHHLLDFNDEDTDLKKDIIRFKSKK